MRDLLHAFILAVILTAPPATATTLRIQVTARTEVFARPNLQSDLVTVIEPGTALLIDTDKVIGEGGLGVFFKVQTADAKIGYVVDSDLVLSTAKPANPPQVKRKPQPRPKANQAPPAPKARNRPLIGLTIGGLDYAETLNGERRSAAQIFIGARHSGRPLAFLGLFLDFGLLAAPGAPKFLSAAGASGKTSGFTLMAEALGNWPIVDTESFMLFFGLGPMLAHTHYETRFDDGPRKVDRFRAGGVADLGAAYRFGAGRARLDFKYHAEAESYPGAFLGFELAY